MTLLLDTSFLAAASAHFVIDFLNSMIPLILAVLSVPLGLSNTTIGLVNALAVWTGSLSQPFFGLLVDKAGSKRMATLGIAWMMIAFSLALIRPGPVSLALLVLSVLGSGAFHPAGTMQATLRGKASFEARETTAASFFFLFGQIGLTMGPVLGGLFADHWGLQGLLITIGLVLPIVMFAVLRWNPSREEPDEKPATLVPLASVFAPGVVFFILLTGFRSWTQANMTVFLPKFFSDLGYAPGAYGMIAGLFMAGSAAGNMVGGWSADRFDSRKVLSACMLLAAIPFILYPSIAETIWVYPITILAGFLTGIPHPILVVAAQRMLPGRVGTASGIILGLTFASGSLGTLVSGLQADRWGFDPVFISTAGIAAVTALLVWGVPKSPLVSAISHKL